MSTAEIKRQRARLSVALLATAHPELRAGSIVSDAQAENIVDRISDLIEAHVEAALLREREHRLGHEG